MPLRKEKEYKWRVQCFKHYTNITKLVLVMRPLKEESWGIGNDIGNEMAYC
jgi:hypothetical protein